MTSKAKNQQVCQDEACHLGEGGGEGGGDEQHQGGHGCSNQVALHGRHKIAPRLTFLRAQSSQKQSSEDSKLLKPTHFISCNQICQ